MATAADLAALRLLCCEGDAYHRPTDHVLRRFLAARKGNVEAAAEQWKRTMAWRNEHDIAQYRRNGLGPAGWEHGAKGFQAVDVASSHKGDSASASGRRGVRREEMHYAERLVEHDTHEGLFRTHCGFMNFG
jgi:hypothetical protein